MKVVAGQWAGGWGPWTREKRGGLSEEVTHKINLSAEVSLQRLSQGLSRRKDKCRDPEPGMGCSQGVRNFLAEGRAGGGRAGEWAGAESHRSSGCSEDGGPAAAKILHQTI